MRSAALAALLAALVGPGASAPVLSADLYKWVDDSGTVHYSNLPPAAPPNVEHLTALQKHGAVVSGDAVRDLHTAAKVLSHTRPSAPNLPGSPSLIDRATSDSIAARLLRTQIPSVAVK
jgi:hypothetical protein